MSSHGALSSEPVAADVAAWRPKSLRDRGSRLLLDAWLRQGYWRKEDKTCSNWLLNVPAPADQVNTEQILYATRSLAPA
jgi:hypothetical protein